MARCLLISNRLPVSFHEKSQSFIPSSGGLVSAIMGLNPAQVGYDFEWMGLMTDDIEKEKLNELYGKVFGQIKCHPIIVNKQTYDDHYNKYCNDVLWPLFHYERSMVHHSSKGWKAYQEVNQIVANAIIAEARDDDTVWIHDFQLFLVPGLVKKVLPNLKIGFFLHIPFPSSEIFREIPQRQELLHSLMTCDQIGFHDLSYLTHFKTSLQRILGVSPDFRQERKWGVYPISIDTKYFEQLAVRPETKELVNMYQESKLGRRWILGIDRLDYTKGLIQKLRAYREFLKKYPFNVGLVQFFQVVIPSRTDVQEYKRLKDSVEQLVSSINGEFGTPTYMPVHYLYHSVTQAELSALYQVSDVLHIGSRRDGMNLVCLEYVVSKQKENPGAILLSEFAGAHSTLSYAFSINPWDIGDTADKMQTALYHPDFKKQSEMESMQGFLRHYTSSDWARVFLNDLHQEPPYQEEVPSLSSDGYFPWMDHLSGKKVLIFCDLDGTLLPIAQLPSAVRMTDHTRSMIRALSENPNCQFVIVSGRDKEFMQSYLIDSGFHFPMAACHGAYAYNPKDHQWFNLVAHDSTKWKDTVLEFFKIYTMRTPGSFIEDKGHAITWHYRNSPANFAEFLANKLSLELDESLSSQPAQVHRGKKVVEVKSIHANKGSFVQHWLQNMSEETKPDLIIALGDDTTDEDMFNALQEQTIIPAFCIKVGHESSKARHSIREQARVNLFLDRLLSNMSAPAELSQ